MTLGIDLGGTNLCLGLVDNGKVISMASVPSFDCSFTLEQTLEYLAEQISSVFVEGVEKIGAYAFANLTALEEVVLPSTLQSIEYGAFYGCSALKTI